MTGEAAGTTLCGGCAPDSAAERAQPGGNVGEVVVGLVHHGEEAPGGDDVATAVVEVAEHVPLAKMVVARAPGRRRRRSHDAQCAGEITLVGTGTGGDDASLGEQRRSRGGRLQLAPQ